MDDFQWLIAREIPYLRRFARALTGNTDAADDLVQDTLERALHKRHLWRPRGSLRAWLYRVLYNVHLNAARGRLLDRLSVIDSEAGEKTATPATQDRHVEMLDVVAALEHLPRGQRDAILVVGVEGLSYDQAAWVLGIRLGTLRSRLCRGREALWRLREGAAPRANLRRVK